MVEREMNGVVLRREAVNDKMGQIQIRANPAGDLEVGLSKGCFQVK
jgi:hypothetical protein